MVQLKFTLILSHSGFHTGISQPTQEGYIPIKHVYLIQSQTHPERRYTGITTDLRARLAAHNQGKSKHTAKYRPWKLITVVSFTDNQKARAFESYLKSGSGRAFAHKRLW